MKRGSYHFICFTKRVDLFSIYITDPFLFVKKMKSYANQNFENLHELKIYCSSQAMRPRIYTDSHAGVFVSSQKCRILQNFRSTYDSVLLRNMSRPLFMSSIPRHCFLENALIWTKIFWNFMNGNTKSRILHNDVSGWNIAKGAEKYSSYQLFAKLKISDVHYTFSYEQVAFLYME